MPVSFDKATKKFARARVGIVGPAGSGKTYTALTIAAGLVAIEGGRIALVDTERGSASKYAHKFDFDHALLETFDPRLYVEAIDVAARAGYTVLILDSLSHAWTGKGGALDLKDAAARRSRSGNTFDAWREVTPLHNQLVDAMLQAPLHIIATMRVKTEYVIEEQHRNGRTVNVPKKVGMAPIQREGLDYEFDVVGDMSDSNTWTITKSRCEALNGVVINRPDYHVAETIHEWLSDGVPSPESGVADGPPASSPLTSSSPTPAPELNLNLEGEQKTAKFLDVQAEQKVANAARAKLDASAVKNSNVKDACEKLGVPPSRAFMYVMQNFRDEFDLRKLDEFLTLQGDRADAAIKYIEEHFKDTET